MAVPLDGHVHITQPQLHARHLHVDMVALSLQKRDGKCTSQ